MRGLAPLCSDARSSFKLSKSGVRHEAPAMILTTRLNVINPHSVLNSGPR